ncbi:MAG: PEGA domain-containing protein [Deltaproteobacteria bacterium]|nr:PEGA domain-containing protein [Deltaproteobacteria bacterium]
MTRYLAGLLLLLVPYAAQAQEASPGRRVAVLLLGAGEVDDALASDLTEVLIAAVGAREGQTVIGKEEFQARLGQDEERSRQCVESPICLANVGAELAVDEIIAGTVASSTGGYRLSLARQEIASGEVKGRFTREVQGDQSALVAAVQEAAVEIYREPERPAELRVQANVEGAEVFVDDQRAGMTPLRLTDLAPGRHRVRVDALGFRAETKEVRLRSGGHARLDFMLAEAPSERVARGGRPASPFAVVTTWTSVGLALSAGALGTVMALRSQGGFDEDATQREAELALDEHETEALVANISFVSAGALGALALYLLIFQSDAVFGTAAERPVAVTLEPGGLTLRGWF